MTDTQPGGHQIVGAGEGNTPAAAQQNVEPDVSTQLLNSDTKQLAETSSGAGEGFAVVTEVQDSLAEVPVELNTNVKPLNTEVNEEIKPEVPDVQDVPISEQTNVEKVIPEEVKIDTNTNVTPETQPENIGKPEEIKKENHIIPGDGDIKKDNTDWKQREAELLKKIDELEKVKTETGADGLKLELKVREEEIDLLKARVKNLETELQAVMSKPGNKNHEIVESIKQQHEELLSKARGMIFDKTKMVKNQELQIEALTTQVQSLKDINTITKDLLEIRNAEVTSLEERLAAMEARFKAEKERFGLVLKRAETSSHINDDLRKEYETQLSIFKELREKYEARVQALVAENAKLKDVNALLKAARPGT